MESGGGWSDGKMQLQAPEYRRPLEVQEGKRIESPEGAMPLLSPGKLILF